MPKLFAGYLIAVSGDFGEKRRPNAIKRWVEHQGGKFSSKVEMGVTHLICSKDHYKREVQAVQKAKQLKGCRLVTYDWFDDCLLKKKRLHLKHYEAEDAYGISVKKRTERKR
jgi:hypothetical protein